MIVRSWLLALMEVKPFKWRKAPGPETEMCIRFANDLRAMTLEGKLKGVWTHIPNEIGWGKNKSNQLVYAIAKNMGMIPGSPDYMFIRPGHGLILEAKAPKGQLNPQQKNYREWAASAGVDYHIFKSVEEGKALLKQYGYIE